MRRSCDSMGVSLELIRSGGLRRPWVMTGWPSPRGRIGRAGRNGG
ncbi:hypothetical protein [Lysobacter gummosus]